MLSKVVQYIHSSITYPPTRQKQTEKRSYFKEAGERVTKVRETFYFIFFLFTKCFVNKNNQLKIKVTTAYNVGGK